MRADAVRSCNLALALCLVAATGRTASVGFVDLPHALAVHPLHKVLDAYDRQIAALRGTRAVPGLGDPSTQTSAGATALRSSAATAQRSVASIASDGAARDRNLEAHALGAVRAAQHGAQDAMNAYRDALDRETAANLSGYENSIAQRTSRALAAREQQLRENELALAYDLARRDAGTRLMLRLRLGNLHLDGALRARLQAQLTSLSRRESAALAAARAQDAAVLARYRAQLQRDGASANAQMAAQLRSKAAANLALRRSVLRAASSAKQVAPDLPERLERFASTYRLDSDAAEIQQNLRAAATDIPQRFAQLADGARASRAETSAQVANLQRDRAGLFRAMTAEIVRDAQRLGKARGLRDVVISSSRPKGSVDLTVALEREESRF